MDDQRSAAQPLLLEPSPEMIEAGAQAIAQWDDGAVWPDSWGSDANRHRRDARKAYIAMVEVQQAGLPAAAAGQQTIELPADMLGVILHSLQTCGYNQTAARLARIAAQPAPVQPAHAKETP
ncbi:hypothetical protein [Geopseudomonas aromaticivorans]